MLIVFHKLLLHPIGYLTSCVGGVVERGGEMERVELFYSKF